MLRAWEAGWDPLSWLLKQLDGEELLRRIKQYRDCLFEVAEVALQDVPNEFEVDAEIAVNQAITHTGDAGPTHIWC